MCNNKHPDTIRLEWALDHPSKFRDLVENELWPRYTADALVNKRLIDDTLDKARHMDDPLYDPTFDESGKLTPKGAYEMGLIEKPLTHAESFKPSQDLLDKLGDDMRH